jgi:hypothetical protein
VFHGGRQILPQLRACDAVISPSRLKDLRQKAAGESGGAALPLRPTMTLPARGGSPFISEGS